MKMSFALYKGPNFSGRSDALRHFAWDGATGCKDGQYLSALINNNLSGLARLVSGEVHLHGLRSRRTRKIASGVADALLASIPIDQNLVSLSGGEMVRLLIACAAALRPKRLAIDGLLEQIDRETRLDLLTTVLAPLASEIDIHLSDNDADSLAGLFGKTIVFHRPDSAPNINEGLATIARGFSRERIEAPELRLRDISFRYPRSSKVVLTQASYTFLPGRPYLLKAPNGAGKSTLAKLLAGVLSPQRGDFVVGGKPFSPSHDGSNLLFYAFQNPLDQIFGASAKNYLANLSLVAAKRRTFLKGSFSITIERAIDECGLAPFIDTEPFDLPFVAAKRLSLVAAMVSRSPWLFFDEPALGTDSGGRIGLAGLLGSLCEAGLGIIIVTHGQEFDGLPGQTTVTIKDGQIAEGEPHV